MTFQPTKLDSLSDSLDAEVKSAEILLSRLKSLAPEEDGDEGDGGAGRDKRAVRVERLKRAERAERVVKGYISWLADPSKEFEVDSHISREDAPERDVSFIHPALSDLLVSWVMLTRFEARGSGHCEAAVVFLALDVADSLD